MNKKAKKALAWAGAIALVACFIWFAQDEGTDEEKGFVYLLDSRSNQATPLEEALPVARQMRQHLTVAVTTRPTSSVALMNEPQQLFDEFRRTQDTTLPTPLFFVITKPYADTQKRLRAEIESQKSIDGKKRTELLQRLVAVRATDDVSEREGCKSLQDDIDYAQWNFRGLALLVGDDTLEPLRQCLQRIAPAPEG